MISPEPYLLECSDLYTGYHPGKKSEIRLTGPLQSRMIEGELIAVMGPNGSGKSTLLRTLVGLQEPVSGEVRLKGKARDRYSRLERARMLSFVSTEAVRAEGLSIRTLVSLGRYPHTGWMGRLGRSDHEKVDQVIRQTGLSLLAEKRLDEISDGERQRAMLARSMAQDTPLLVMDEPTAFLDMGHRYELIRLLQELSRKHGKTILFSTHDAGLAVKMSDRIWMLEGSALREGAPEDLALDGTLERVLAGGDGAEALILDPRSGQLIPGRNTRHPVQVECSEEDLKVWTMEALGRLGYQVTADQQALFRVLVSRKESKTVWQVQKSGEIMDFHSLYDLSLYLRTVPHQTIQS